MRRYLRRYLALKVPVLWRTRCLARCLEQGKIRLALRGRDECPQALALPATITSIGSLAAVHFTKNHNDLIKGHWPASIGYPYS